MQIIRNCSLKAFNSLGVSEHCDYMAEVLSKEDIRAAIEFANSRSLPSLVLGGGSNVVLSKRVTALVILNKIKGISRDVDAESLSSCEAIYRVGAGENWHKFVRLTIEQGYGGLENLSLIPGTCGAAPIQNIGAYGVEVESLIESVEVYDTLENTFKTFSPSECQFGYRESLFKKHLSRYVIHHVSFRLSRESSAVLAYGALVNRVPIDKINDYRFISDIVSDIRNEKLPDPGKIPNAGSFFKNPVITNETAERLLHEFPDIVHYPDESGVKLAAGWLIEKAGWKGFRNLTVGVHDKQALVLINHNNGSGKDILALAENIKQSVFNLFGVKLDIEPNVV